jgi:hypothetical protein
VTQWFVVRSGSEEGPITPQQLKQLAESGQLRPDDLVRREDAQTARPAREIKGLFAPSPGSPPPVPSQAATSQPSPPAAKSPVKTAAIGCLGVFALLTVCGGIINVVSNRGGDKGGTHTGGSSENVLTADFYPFKEGTQQRTIFVLYVGQIGQIQQQNIYTHERDGKIRVQSKNCFALHFSPRATINLPPDSTKSLFRRVKDGYVEVGWVGEFTNDVIWERLIKLGAKVGDEWQQTILPGGSTDTYKLTKLEMMKWDFENVVPSGEVLGAVIERRSTTPTPQGPEEFVQEILLGHGVGLLQRETWWITGGGRERKWSEFAH